jgi:predicted dehydrogenase
MSNKTLKVGLIGLGKMGKNHLRILSMLKSVSLEFIYDIDVPQAKELANQYEVSLVLNLESALNDVEAVVICTPTSTHFEYIKLVGEYVKNIFVEKPLTETQEKSRQVLEYADVQKLNIQIGFIERFNPAIEDLKTILTKNSPIINIDFTRTNKLSSRITDVNVITDLMIHDIDLALYLNGPVKTLTANGVIENGMVAFANATLHHLNGSYSRILASRITEKKIRLIQATCQDMFIYCDLLRKEIIINKQSVTNQSINQPYTISSVEEMVAVLPQEALLNELQTFVAFCNGKEVSIPNVNDGLNATIVCDKIQQCIGGGK